MKNVLILGGSGRLGTMLSERLTDCNVMTLSRSASVLDNHIQSDIIDFDNYNDFDTVIHCAAMKNVVECEGKVEECIRTNILGTANALSRAAKAGVKKFIYISTDMAVEPWSVYGTSKKLADSLVAAAARDGEMQTAILRIGNIIGKKGSVFNLFAEKAIEFGYIPITDPKMTRFFMKAEDCADFVINVAHKESLNGCAFVPKCKSYRICDVAEAVAPNVPTKIIGLRPGDVLGVTMVSEYEVQRTVSEKDYFRIYPYVIQKDIDKSLISIKTSLTSANNPRFATVQELRELYKSIID